MLANTRAKRPGLTCAKGQVKQIARLGVVMHVFAPYIESQI